MLDLAGLGLGLGGGVAVGWESSLPLPAKIDEGGTAILDCRRLPSIGIPDIRQSGVRRNDSTALARPGDDLRQPGLQPALRPRARPRLAPAVRAQPRCSFLLVGLALDDKVIECRFQSKRAQTYIRIQLFPSTFK